MEKETVLVKDVKNVGRDNVEDTVVSSIGGVDEKDVVNGMLITI